MNGTVLIIKGCVRVRVGSGMCSDDAEYTVEQKINGKWCADALYAKEFDGNALEFAKARARLRATQMRTH